MNQAVSVPCQCSEMEQLLAMSVLFKADRLCFFAADMTALANIFMH